jgi:hypothetical protein
LRAFFRTKTQLEQDEIASRQLHALIAFQRPRDKRLRLADVKEMRDREAPGCGHPLAGGSEDLLVRALWMMCRGGVRGSA